MLIIHLIPYESLSIFSNKKIPQAKVHFNRNLFTCEDAQGFIRDEMNYGEILLLENVRMKKEEEILVNTKKKLKEGKAAEEDFKQAQEAHNRFSQALFKGVDIFILDGFGVAHRGHAS